VFDINEDTINIYRRWEKISEEEYHSLSRKDKIKYHSAMGKGRPQSHHWRVAQRMRMNSEFTAPYDPTTVPKGLHIPTVSEEAYQQLTRDEQRKYHVKMAGRYKRLGNKEKMSFHNRSAHRLTRGYDDVPYEQEG